MKQPRTIAAAVALCVVLGSSTSSSAMFVVYRTQWGLTAPDIALVFSAYVCTLLPVLVLCGGFADRYGRRRVIAAGVVFAIAGMIALVLAHDIRWLVAGRLLQGVGMGLATGALTAAFVENYRGWLPPGSAGTATQSVGLFAGPLLTATVYDLGAGPNLAYAPMLLLLIAVLPLTLMLGAPVAAADRAVTPEEPYPPRVVWRVLLFALPVTFVSWAGLSLFLSLVPAYLSATLHAHDPLVGAGAIVAVQSSSLLATLWARNIDPVRLGISAPVVMLAGLALLVTGTGINNWPLIVLATLLVGAGGGVAFAAAVGVGGRVGRGQRARIFTRLFVAAYLGFSLPAVVIGAIAARSSLTDGFITVIVALAIVTASLPLVRTRERTYSPM